MANITDRILAAGQSGGQDTGTVKPEASSITSRIMNPTGAFLEESLNQQRPWEEVHGYLKDQGQDPETIRQSYQLQLAKRKVAGQGMSLSQDYRSRVALFSSIVTLPETLVQPLDYLNQKIGDARGVDIPMGGMVVGRDEYHKAINAAKENKATQDDIDKIAAFERMQQLRDDDRKNKSFAFKLAHTISDLSPIISESMIGAQAIQGLGAAKSLYQAGRAAQPLAAAATTAAATAPKLPITPLWQQAAGYGASRVIPTLATPSLWVPMMQQNNMTNNRAPNDWKGAPTALGYAYANMLVLGQLQTGNSGPLLWDAAKKGVAGMVEMQGVEAAAGLADDFLLSDAYKIKPGVQGGDKYGTVGTWLKAYRSGDRDKATEALEDATIQAISFSALAAMHGKTPEPGKSLATAYADTYGKLREAGKTKAEAAEVLASMHKSVEAELVKHPYLTRSMVKDIFMNAKEPAVKEYAQALADAFQPAPGERTTARGADTTQLPETQPGTPRAELAGQPDYITRGQADQIRNLPLDQGQRQQPNIQKPVSQSPVSQKPEQVAAAATPTAPTPAGKATPPRKLPNPNPGETREDFQARLESLNVGAGLARNFADAWFAGHPGNKPVAPPIEAKTESPRDKADRLTTELQDLDKKVLNADRAAKAAESNAATGGSPQEAKRLRKEANRLDREQKAKARELSDARDAYHLSEATKRDKTLTTGQTPEAVPSPSEAPKVQPEATGATPEPFTANARDEALAKRLGIKTDELPGHARSVETAPPGERFHTANYKDPARSVDKAVEMLDKRTESSLPLETWQDKTNAVSQAAPDTATFIIDTKNYSGVVRGRKGIDNLSFHEHALSHDPALKAVVYKGKPEGAKYEKLKEAVDEANARRKERGLEPIKLEVTERRVKEGEGTKRVGEFEHVPKSKEWQAKFDSLKDLVGEKTAAEIASADHPQVEAAAASGVENANAKAEEVKSAAPPTVEPKPKKEPAGKAPKQKKPAAEPKPAETPVETSRRVSKDLSKDSQTSIENAIANVGDGASKRTLAEAIGYEWRAAYELGQMGKATEISKVLIELGAKKVGPDVGQKTTHSNALYESQKELFPGEEATVKRRPITLDGNTIVKGQVEEVAAAATSEGKAPEAKNDKLNAVIRDQWSEMSEAERKAIAADEAQRGMYEDAGVDVANDLTPKKNEGRNIQRTSTAEVPQEVIDRISQAPGVKPTEAVSLAGLARGESLSAIAKRTGLSESGIRKAAGRALEKVKAQDTYWADVENVQGLIDRIAQDRLRAIREKQEREANTGEKKSNLFAGLPLRLTALEGIFGKPGVGGGGPLAAVRRFIFGDRPEAAEIAKREEIDQQIAAYMQDIVNTQKDFRKALKDTGKRYEDLSPEGLAKLDELLRVPPEQTLAAAATQGIPPAVAETIQSMRRQVDKLSQALIDSGAVDGPLKLLFEKNQGFYLTRQYEVFRNPKWFQEVPEPVVNRFKSWLKAELERDGKQPTDADVEAMTRSLLVDGTAAENPIAFLSKSRLGSKDLSILTKRKDIPEELRALWGEHKDPLVNYANSVAKMSHLLTSHEFLTRVAREGYGKFLFDGSNLGKFLEEFPDSHPVKIAAEGSETMSPLNGYYTTPEIKRSFEETFSKQNIPKLLEFCYKAVALTKYSKTVLSPVTHIRNFLGNVGFAVANGHWRIGHMPEALKSIVKDTPEARAYWRKLTELGVVGEGLHQNEFKSMIEDALGGRKDASLLDATSLMTDTSLARGLKKGANFATKLYGYEDAVWKVYAFENEAKRYESTGMSRTMAEMKAAEIVRATYPTYSMIPQGLREARKLPIAPFASFPAEVVRTTKNTFFLALSELRDPKTRAIGATRMAGLAAAATFSSGLAAFSRAAFGMDSEKEKSARRYMPEYEKNSQVFWYGYDENKNPKYIDLSRTDPHANLTDIFIAATRGKDARESAMLAGKAALKPFTDPEMLTSAAGEAVFNSKLQGGQVYNPQETPLEKAKAIGEHLFKAGQPGFLQTGARIKKALTGEPDQKTGRVLSPTDELSLLPLGQRVEALHIEDDLSNKAKGFNAAHNDAAKITNQMIKAKGNVDEKELLAAAARTDAARKKGFEELKQDVDAAEKLGVPREKIIKILRDAEVSQDDLNQLFHGTVHPYRPVLKGTQMERGRAATVRKQEATSLQQSPQP